MEFQKVMEIRKRMTKDCRNGCRNCPISNLNNGEELDCTKFMYTYPERYEQILIDWDKENPVETRLTKLLKEYPVTPLDDNGIPNWICVKSLGYKEDCSKSCVDCWNVPVEITEVK